MEDERKIPCVEISDEELEKIAGGAEWDTASGKCPYCHLPMLNADRKALIAHLRACVYSPYRK